MGTIWTTLAEQPVFATLPNTPIQVGSTQRVEFDMDLDAMTVSTRTVEAPEFSYIVGPPGVTYDDVPVGMNYPEFDWSAI